MTEEVRRRIDMAYKSIDELRSAADETAAAWGWAMGEWERGRVSGHELGVLKRRMNLAAKALQQATYADEAMRDRPRFATLVAVGSLDGALGKEA